ncbi:TIGR03943 family putative permease subunit [Metabacillus sp. RGM 3146]|uniref:TIGR03943 family putative permease subunit n=1 Tax=Metabacillus sp. RGM 3146 TaxID=3401092 RepID=UPI003B98EF4B
MDTNNKPPERIQNHPLLRGILLTGFSLLLIKLALSGEISNFIAPRMNPFIYFTIIVLMGLCIVNIFRGTSNKPAHVHCHCDGDHSYPDTYRKSLFLYSLFFIPIVTGLLFSANVLDSSVVSKRQIQFGASSSQSAAAKTVNQTKTNAVSTKDAEEYLKDPKGYMKKMEQRVQQKSQAASANQTEPLSNSELNQEKKKLLAARKITVNDQNYLKVMLILQENLPDFIGKEIVINGFVYRDQNYASDEIALSRFIITCCAADATVYGYYVKGDLSHVDKDSWIIASGKIGKTEKDGQTFPIVKMASYKKISVPSNVYIYDNGTIQNMQKQN